MKSNKENKSVGSMLLEEEVQARPNTYQSPGEHEKKQKSRPLNSNQFLRFNPQQPTEPEQLPMTRDRMLGLIQANIDKRIRLPGFEYYTAEEKLDTWNSNFGRCHFCYYIALKGPMVNHVASQHHKWWHEDNDTCDYVVPQDALINDPPKYVQNENFHPDSLEARYIKA